MTELHLTWQWFVVVGLFVFAALIAAEGTKG